MTSKENHLYNPHKGTLTPAKTADIVVLSEDIMTIPEDQIRSTRVDYTIIDGNIAYTNHTSLSILFCPTGSG